MTLNSTPPPSTFEASAPPARPEGIDVGSRFRQWGKILVSGALFLMLGIGGMALSFLVLPVLRVFSTDRARFQRRARFLIHAFFRLFVFALQASGIFRVETENFPDQAALEGMLVIANHPSYLDIVVIVSLLRQAICVVKEPVWNSFFFGGLVRAAGYVPIQDPEGVLGTGAEALCGGGTLVMFPEGTRSQPGQPFKFQRGAAHIALRSGSAILPLVLTCDPPLLEKGRRWFQIPVQTCRFRLCARDPIPLAQILSADPPPGSAHQAARRLTDHFEALYNQQLGNRPN